MIKILLIAISLSYQAVDSSVTRYDSIETVMTIPQDMYGGTYIISLMPSSDKQDIVKATVEDKNEWQLKETRLSQKGDTVFSTKA